MARRKMTLEYMRLTLVPFEDAAANFTRQFRDGFKTGFGENLPPDAAEALHLIDDALAKSRPEVESRVAEVIEEHLTEEQVDALVAHLKSPLGEALRAASPAIAGALAATTNAWLDGVLNGLQSELQHLLGVTQEIPPPSDPLTCDGPPSAPSS